MRTLVQHLSSVLLSSDRRRQVDGNHSQQGVTSWQPRLHHGLHERLATLLELVLVLRGNLHVELLDELHVLLLAEVHDRRKDLEDRVEHELVETAHVALIRGSAPFLLARAVEVVAPEALHEFGHLDLELGRVDLGELLERESPTVQTGTKADRTFCRVDLLFQNQF